MGISTDNTISPKVYDIEDVVGFQGAFVALPALFVYLLTYVRVNEVDAVDIVSRFTRELQS